jgi:hypothetical protein
MKDLVNSIPIYTIEVLKEQVENPATTIRNNRGMVGKSGRIISSTHSLLYRCA